MCPKAAAAPRLRTWGAGRQTRRIASAGGCSPGNLGSCSAAGTAKACLTFMAIISAQLVGGQPWHRLGLGSASPLPECGTLGGRTAPARRCHPPRTRCLILQLRARSGPAQAWWLRGVEGSAGAVQGQRWAALGSGTALHPQPPSPSSTRLGVVGRAVGAGSNWQPRAGLASTPQSQLSAPARILLQLPFLSCQMLGWEKGQQGDQIPGEAHFSMGEAHILMFGLEGLSLPTDMLCLHSSAAGTSHSPIIPKIHPHLTLQAAPLLSARG